MCTFSTLVQVFEIRRSQTFSRRSLCYHHHDLKNLTERLTINRSQSDGAEQPCDDANGGHLRFPLSLRLSPHIIRAFRALERTAIRKMHYVKPRVHGVKRYYKFSCAFVLQRRCFRKRPAKCCALAPPLSEYRRGKPRKPLC